MARGTETGTRGGSRAQSELGTKVRGILTAKSPAKGLGNLVKSYRTKENAKGGFAGEEEVTPTPELIAMANQSLENAERAAVGADNEHAAVYKDGVQLFVKTSSSANYVDFNAKESKAMKDAIFTHNHPAPNGVPIPFSRGDVVMLLKNKCQEFRAVSGNMAFSMKPPKDSPFWKMTGPKLQKMMDGLRAAEIASRGYGLSDPLPDQVLADVLDSMLTKIDSKIPIGYTKKTL
jgi:hypothetical protein